MKIKRILISAVLLSAVWAQAGFAGFITEYTDKPSFDAAVGPTVLEDFLPSSHFPINSGILNDQTNEAGINPGDIQSGVTYSTPIGTGNFFNIDAGGGYVGGFLDRIGNDADLTITFDAPVGAFGFDTNSLMGTQFGWTIYFVSGPPQAGISSVANNTNMQFFGFQSDAVDIESVVIRGDNATFAFALDNFAFDGEAGGTLPTPVPTLSTYGLLLAFLGMLFIARRRFLTVKAPAK